MKKKRKTTSIIISITICIGLILIIVTRFNLLGAIIKVEDTYAKNLEMINKTESTNIMIYGEPISFRYKFDYHIVSDINEFSLDSDDAHKFIIINDKNDEIILTDSDYIYLLNLIKTNNYDFFYVGANKLENFETHGYFSNLSPKELGFGIHNHKLVTGYWTDNYEKIFNQNHAILGDRIVQFLADCLK